MKKIKINISTRLLTYFLFVTILPLFVLAISSAFLINSSLNNNLIQEFNTNNEKIWEIYNNSRINFIATLKTSTNPALIKDISSYNSSKNNTKINNNLYIIAQKHNLALISIFDSNKNLLFSSGINKDIFKNFKTIDRSSLNLKNIFNMTKKEGFSTDSQIVNLEDLSKLALTNKKTDKDFSKKWGFLAQVGIVKINVSNKDYYLLAIDTLSQASSYSKQMSNIYKSYFENLQLRNNNLILKISLLATLAGITLAYLLARIITKPILLVTNAAKSIEEGDFSKRIELKSGDELEYLAQSFNSMALSLQKRKELEQVKDDFLATLTHDLKVPLLANAQTLEHLLRGLYGQLAEKQEFILNQLVINSKDILRMVNTILDSYKYEAGKQTLIKTKTNINKLIEECMFEIMPLAQEKNHQIMFLPHDSEINATIDRQEIKRVIMNLLSNAIAYTQDQGKIEIYTKSEKNEIMVSIKDNGIGISELSLKKLFERYSREAKTFRKIGTGLGLYLSKQIIEAHNGKIWVDSILNEGSVFHFSIPE